MNHDAPPNRTCVTCKHAGLNQTTNLSASCLHPDSPINPIWGRDSCQWMRRLRGPCGPHGNLWTERTPPAKRKSPFTRVVRWFKGNAV